MPFFFSSFFPVGATLCGRPFRRADTWVCPYNRMKPNPDYAFASSRLRCGTGRDKSRPYIGPDSLSVVIPAQAGGIQII